MRRSSQELEVKTEGGRVPQSPEGNNCGVCVYDSKLFHRKCIDSW